MMFWSSNLSTSCLDTFLSQRCGSASDHRIPHLGQSQLPLCWPALKASNFLSFLQLRGFSQVSGHPKHWNLSPYSWRLRGWPETSTNPTGRPPLHTWRWVNSYCKLLETIRKLVPIAIILILYIYIYINQLMQPKTGAIKKPWSTNGFNTKKSVETSAKQCW